MPPACSWPSGLHMRDIGVRSLLVIPEDERQTNVAMNSSLRCAALVAVRWVAVASGGWWPVCSPASSEVIERIPLGDELLRQAFRGRRACRQPRW
jgi:hypothetical protein